MLDPVTVFRATASQDASTNGMTFAIYIHAIQIIAPAGNAVRAQIYDAATAGTNEIAELSTALATDRVVTFDKPLPANQISTTITGATPILFIHYTRK